MLITDAHSQVGKKIHTIVWQSIILAMAVKGLFIVLIIFSIVTLCSAIFADVSVAL